MFVFFLINYEEHELYRVPTPLARWLHDLSQQTQIKAAFLPCLLPPASLVTLPFILFFPCNSLLPSILLFYGLFGSSFAFMYIILD